MANLLTYLSICIALAAVGCTAGPNTTSTITTIPNVGRLNAIMEVSSLSPDDPAWASAAFSETLTGPIPETNATIPDVRGLTDTRAKFLWDDRHLHVLIESIGGRPQSDFQRQDDLLHQADVVEVFLSSTPDRREIIELQVSPNNVTADYLHVWRQAPTYPPENIDIEFYKANHKADIAWDLNGLRTMTRIDPLPDGRARWTTTIAIPLDEAAVRVGLPATLHAGQAVWLNVMRYAYYSDDAGKRTFRQYNLVPVRFGRPHQSPNGMMELVLRK